jgi:orotate phosphoribosyltransferase
MGTEIFAVSREELRAELAADLARGGYVYEEETASDRVRYFDKYLVLSRPGILTRAAKFLAELVPPECERIAVTGIASAVVGGAVAQHGGVPLVLGLDRDGAYRFGGEIFPRIRVVLLEDVIDTGSRALEGATALSNQGIDVIGVLCLLDRERGSSRKLAQAGYPLRALFTESELVAA